MRPRIPGQHGIQIFIFERLAGDKGFCRFLEGGGLFQNGEEAPGMVVFGGRQSLKHLGYVFHSSPTGAFCKHQIPEMRQQLALYRRFKLLLQERIVPFAAIAIFR